MHEDCKAANRHKRFNCSMKSKPRLGKYAIDVSAIDENNEKNWH